MTPDEYAKWWNDNTGPEGELLRLGEPLATLARHVQALQSRIERLPRPGEEPDVTGTTWITQCCCAYDHPDDVCMVHER